VLAIDWSSEDPQRRNAVQYEVLGTAMGGGAGADGHSGVAVNDTVAVLAPIEVLESQFPVRIKRFELIPDSGGPGEHRGGLSYRREYEALARATVNRRADGGRLPARGLNGGRPGRLGSLTIVSGGQSRAVSVAGRYVLERGDRLIIEGAGAGGYGDPTTRSPERVLADRRRGYVSDEVMTGIYKVAAAADGSVDDEATSALRGADAQRPG
jgi:N-methylhydantoinase B